MQHLSRRSIGLFVAALALVSVSAQQSPAPASEQSPPAEQPQQQPPPPRFRIEANFVRVDAFPTRNGQPVQDLRAEEFEVLENGVRQEISTFEHVVVSPGGPQRMRAEADSVRGGEQMAANPRNRVFVFFLDVPHVAVEGGHRIKEPLIRLMDRILGADDLVAVMTPEMSAAQITFGRKTQVIADMLREEWAWGRRHSIVDMDQQERNYQRCYPPTTDEVLARQNIAPVVQKMIARRRERMVLDALHDLVRYLGGVREERKAILAVTEGWVLYRPDPSMTKLRCDSISQTCEEVPGRDPIGVDEFGKLRSNPPRRGPGEEQVSQTICDRERMYLGSLDNEDYFRHLFDMANRNNASFYPIDPRGLPAFDYPIGPAAPPPLHVDRASLNTRLQNLRTLAENTDGMAVIGSNDLDRGLRRIADDLTSYYLLGYYSSNTKLDGSYRRLAVRVRRPGVEVRARRGYRAATAEEVNASRVAAAAPVPDHIKTTNAALAGMSRVRPEQRFSIHAVAMRRTPDGPVTAVWVVGELHGAPQEFAAGGTAVVDLGGGATGNAAATLKAGERAFVIKVPVEAVNAPIDVRARLAAERAPEEPLSDAARVEIDPAAVRPLLFRRGLSTGNRVQPAADFRFSRTERLRLELPIGADATPGAGRFVDRNAQPLQVPVQVSERAEDGQRWLVAEATLSALGAGDYVVEVSYTAGRTERKVLTPVRVTR